MKQQPRMTINTSNFNGLFGAAASNTTTGESDPDGGTNAGSIVETVGNGSHFIQMTTPPTANGTININSRQIQYGNS